MTPLTPQFLYMCARKATERISVREMVTGIRSAIDELRVTADEVTSLRLNLTGVMDEVAADSATAVRLPRLPVSPSPPSCPAPRPVICHSPTHHGS